MRIGCKEGFIAYFAHISLYRLCNDFVPTLPWQVPGKYHKNFIIIRTLV